MECAWTGKVPIPTVDRQLQSLHMLGVLACDEEAGLHRGQDVTLWRYRLADGIEPEALDPDSVPDMLETLASLSFLTHKNMATNLALTYAGGLMRPDGKGGEAMTSKAKVPILTTLPSERPGVKREAGKRGARAAIAHHEALRAERVLPVEGPFDAHRNQFEADRKHAEAGELVGPVSPTGVLVTGAGEAIAHEPTPGSYDGAVAYLVDTLENPSSIAVEASEQRMRAALDLGVLQSCIDAAVTAQAQTSLEKMLCHEIAAAHHASMVLLARGLDSQLPPVDVARLLNTAARLMDTVQAGQLTLVRARSAGRQHVTVQHQYVQVNQGGQAIVAGQIKPKRRARGSGELTGGQS
jgi:hypothetical protein